MEKNTAENSLINKIRIRNKNISKGPISPDSGLSYLRHHTSFGIPNYDIPGQLSLVSEHEILYYVSNMLIVKDINNKSYTFLSKQGRLRNVTALACSYRDQADECSMLVAGESSHSNQERKSSVCILTYWPGFPDKTEWKVLNTLHRGKIESLEINPSKKLCYCHLTDPTTGLPVMLIWKLVKDQLIVNHTFKHNECIKIMANPKNQRQLLTISETYFKVWEVNGHDKSLKSMQMAAVPKDYKDTKFIDFMWMNWGQTQWLILISSNKIFILANEQVKKVVSIDKDELKVRKFNMLQKEIEKSLEEIYQMKQIFDEMLKENDKDFLAKEKQADEKLLDRKLELTCLIRRNSFKPKQGQRNTIVCGANNGLLLFYEIDRAMTLAHNLSFQLGTQENIKSLYTNKEMSTISCISKNEHTLNLKFSLVKTGSFDTEEPPVVNFFGDGQHCDRINSVSCAVLKDVFATTAADKTVKIWSYADIAEKKSMLSVEFKDEPLNAAIHPLGFLMAVNFKTQIRLFSLLASQLFLMKAIKHLEDCRMISFSHHGHFLVTNEYSCIKLYDSVELKLINIYQIQQNKLWLTHYYLSYEDTQLVACYNNGQIYVWDIDFGASVRHIPENEREYYKGLPSHIEPAGYKALVYDGQLRGREGDTLFVGTNQYKYLTIYSNRCKDLVTQFAVTDTTIQSLCLSKELGILIAGTNRGTVRLYGWPLDESSLLYEVINAQLSQVRFALPWHFEMQVHSRHVVAVAVTDDCRYLISGGDDGTLMLSEIVNIKLEEERRNQKSKEQIAKAREDRKKLMEITNNLFLIKSSDIHTKNDLIKKSELDVLKAEQAIKKEKFKREKEFSTAIERRKKDFEALIQQELKLKENNLAAQNEDIKELEDQYNSELKDFRNFTMKARQDHMARKAYELQRNADLESQIESVKKEHLKRLDELLQEHKQDVVKIKKEYFFKMQELQKQYQAIAKEGQQVSKALDNQIEDIPLDDSDDDEEVKNLKNDIERLRETNAHLMIKNTEVMKEYEDKKAKDEEIQLEFQDMFEKYNQIRLRNLRNDEEIVKLEHQLVERLQVIDYKEEACREAKEYQINLENFNHILDDKIGGLQAEKHQVIRAIKEKEAELQKMFNELIEENKKNEAKEHEIRNLEARLTVFDNDIKKAEVKIFFNMNRMNNYQHRLEKLLEIDSAPQLAAQLGRLLDSRDQADQLEAYLSKPRLTNADIREIVKLKQEKSNTENEELLKYGSWMTKKLNLMKVTSKKIKDIKEDNIAIVLRQNQKLLEECNLLRTENQVIDREIAKAQKQIDELSAEDQKLKSMRNQDTKIKSLERRLRENQQELESQNMKLHNINEFVSQFRTGSPN